MLLWVRTKPTYLNACLSFQSVSPFYMSPKQRCLWAPLILTHRPLSKKQTISEGAGKRYRLDFYLNKVQQQLFTSWNELLHLFFTNFLITWEKKSSMKFCVILLQLFSGHFFLVQNVFWIICVVGCAHRPMPVVFQIICNINLIWNGVVQKSLLAHLKIWT